MSNLYWIILVILLALDLLVSAVRSSLLNARLPYLINLREQREEPVNRTVAVLDRPRLRVSLRLSVAVIHFLLAGMALLGMQRVAVAGLSLGWILLILGLACLVLLLVEFAIEGGVLQKTEDTAIHLSTMGLIIDILCTPFSLVLLGVLGTPMGTANGPSSMTEDDLRNWVEVGQPEGSLEKEERQMIYSIFQFRDTLAREIMVPRIDVLALEVNTPLSEAAENFGGSGHSRLPVYEETIDNIVGLLYAKDLLMAHQSPDSPKSIRKLLRPAYFVPEAKKVDELLTEMQVQRVHMAIVVDEYGGVAGLVTLEDIVEEIIGEVRDEYDQGEEMLFEMVGTNEYIFQGRIDLDDFNEVMDTHLTKDVADTLGGFIYGQIGRVPTGGEKIETEDIVLTVEQVTGRSIRSVRAQRKQSTQETETEENHVDR